jgi:hypothetical protein
VTPARPLTRWQSTWRYLFAVLAGLLSWWAALRDQYVDVSPVLPALDLLVGAGAVVLLRWRRSHPLAVAVVLNALTALSGASAGPALIALMSVATRRRWREILPVAAVSIAASLVYFELQASDSGFLTSVVLGAVSLAALTAIGMYVGARRDLARRRSSRPCRPSGSTPCRSPRRGPPSAPASPGRCTTCWRTGCRWSRCTPGRCRTAEA